MTNNSSPKVVDPIRAASCSEQPAWKPNQGGSRATQPPLSDIRGSLMLRLLLGQTMKIWVSRCKRNASDESCVF